MSLLHAFSPKAGRALVAVAVILVGSSLTAPAAHAAGEEPLSLPSNRELLAMAAREAVDEALDSLLTWMSEHPGLPEEEDGALTIGLQAKQPGAGSQFWESLLVHSLNRRGYQIVRLEPLAPATAAAGTGRGRRTATGSAPGDTSATTVGDTAAVVASPDSSASSQTGASGTTAAGATTSPEKAGTYSGPRLRFESLELVLDYPATHGGRFFGSARVDRVAAARLLIGLENGSSGLVRWSAEGHGVRRDTVPQEALVHVEAGGLPVANPEWESNRVYKDLAEPALVAGIVGGLVYLFYANRTD